MKRAEDSPEAGGPCYTLYLEYLGGLVPILKGRRISKLRPEFVIMDPKTDSKPGGPYRVCISNRANYNHNYSNITFILPLAMSNDLRIFL